MAEITHKQIQQKLKELTDLLGEELDEMTVDTLCSQFHDERYDKETDELVYEPTGKYAVTFYITGTASKPLCDDVWLKMVNKEKESEEDAD